ncbi:MAG: flippase-like domain-containing protein [archaeon]|nr:flippase-like domain-containing protein [archaeon]
MYKLVKNSIIVLLAFFALIFVLSYLTNAQQILKDVVVVFLAFGALFFLISVFFWIISWAFLLKKHHKIAFSRLLIIGYSSLYGSLSPVQIGTEALRSLRLKAEGVDFSDALAVGFIVKGVKFLILAIMFLIVTVLFLSNASISGFFELALLSGFAVVLIATLLFLLPFYKPFGKKIINLFAWLAGKIKIFSQVEKFFYTYADYVSKISAKDFIVIFILTALSWLFEILALQYSFISLNIFLSFLAIMVLFVITAVLERTPLLPRGIGLVEFVGFAFLSIPAFTGINLSLPQIGAVLIVYDVVRLIIPTIFSFAVAIFFKVDFEK